MFLVCHLQKLTVVDAVVMIVVGAAWLLGNGSSQ